MVQHKHTAWPNYLEVIENIMNEVHHTTTEFTPIELQLNKKPTRFWQKYIKSKNTDELRYNEKLFLAKTRIQNKREKMNEKINRNRNIIKFNVGDKVLIKANNVSSKENKEISKFFDVFEGEYIIKKIVDDNTYILFDQNKNEERGMFHTENLRPFYQSDDRLV